MAFTKFSNPHKLYHGFQKLMNIFVATYLKVSRKLPGANKQQTNNNSTTKSIIFRTLWKLIILLLFLFVVAMIVVWWEMENMPPPPYDLLEHSHTLLEHNLVFHHKENLGLIIVQAPIQVLTYGCLEGLSELVYTAITKSNICLQHCCCTSSSS